MFDPIAYISEPRWQTVSLGLDRTRELLTALGDPQDRLRFVHVAGTNGKGSTCALVAEVLHRAGHRVGLFTSPALYCFEDRIRVNGQNITSEQLLSATEQVKRAAEAMREHPTEFELLTAVAFLHFARERCDIVVAEVGLGGRLDSTNVIERPEVSIVTPISFDHQAFLGNTLSKIATEKAGIVKHGSPVVVAPQEPEALDAIKAAATRANDELVMVDLAALDGTTECFSYRDRASLSLGLSGPFQLVNAATALDAIDVLKQQGWKIGEEAIREGLMNASWPGRFEIVSSEPLIVFDGGHNAAGLAALADALDESYPDHRRIVVTGVLADKDYLTMARLLRMIADEIITITPPNPRALPAAELARILEDIGREEESETSVVAQDDIPSGVHFALDRYEALREAGEDALICVCGSLYALGSVMEVLRQVGVAL